MKTHDVTMESFEEAVDTHPLVILDFWAGWCQPCKVFAPIFEQLAELNPDIYFGKVDTERAKDLAEAFQIRGVPAILAFKNGDLVFETSGILPPAQMEELFRQLRA